MATMQATYLPRDINDPADLAAWAYPDESTYRGAEFGAHVGGDTALSDGSTGTYVTLRSVNQDAPENPGPSWVSTVRLRTASSIPDGATPESVEVVSSGTATGGFQSEPSVVTATGKDAFLTAEDYVDSPFLVLTFPGLSETETLTLHEWQVVVTYSYDEPEPDPDVTIVPWYPSVAKPLRFTDDGSDSYSTLTHTPEARADILWDFDDGSFIDSGPDGGANWTDEWHADALTPSEPIPPGQPIWVRFHVRVSTHSSGWGWAVQLAGWTDGGWSDTSLWADGLNDIVAADGIVSDTTTLHRGSGDETDDDVYGWGDELNMFGRDYEWPVIIDWATMPGREGRYYELWAEVAYEGAPATPRLRQRQIIPDTRQRRIIHPTRQRQIIP